MIRADGELRLSDSCASPVDALLLATRPLRRVDWTEHGVPFATCCRALGASRAWFYKWRHGDGSLRRARREALAAAVRYLFTKHKRRYGSPRITADLQEMGWRVSVNTVAKLMRDLGR